MTKTIIIATKTLQSPTEELISFEPCAYETLEQAKKFETSDTSWIQYSEAAPNLWIGKILDHEDKMWYEVTFKEMSYWESFK